MGDLGASPPHLWVWNQRPRAGEGLPASRSPALRRPNHSIPCLTNCPTWGWMFATQSSLDNRVFRSKQAPGF